MHLPGCKTPRAPILKTASKQKDNRRRKEKVTLCEIAGLPGRNKVDPLVGKCAHLASQLKKVEEQTVYLAHQLKHIRVTRHRRRPEYPMSTPAPSWRREGLSRGLNNPPRNTPGRTSGV